MTQVATPIVPGRERLLFLAKPALFHRITVVSLIANVAIVVTGGGVRVTKSGLGCPTWPTCTDASLIPTAATAGHGLIEFSNRMVSIALAVVVLSTLVIALVQRRERKLAGLIVGGYFAQAVLGGITVLTDLNPWVVGCHFLLSAAMIAVAFALWWRVRALVRIPSEIVFAESGGVATQALSPPTASSAAVPSTAMSSTAMSPAANALTFLAYLVAAVSAAVLVLGAIVTGSGPHAGDFKKGRVRRNGLSPELTSHIHADAVMLLIGLSIGAIVLTKAVRASDAVVRSAQVLLAVELSQGVVGFVQYFTHLPSLLVLVHMLGACLVWVACLWFVAVVHNEVWTNRRPVLGEDHDAVRVVG